MTTAALGETLVELLAARAAGAGPGSGFRFLPDSGGEDELLGFAALDERARRLATLLSARADRGDRVLLYYPAGLDFLIGFFAAACAGMVGVPVACPRSSPISPREFAPTAAAIADCAPRLALTTEAVLAALPPGAAEGVEWIATDRAGTGAGAAERLDPPGPDDLAYLQYTSGSTAAPKGVMVRHRNVMANLLAIHTALDHPADALGLMWLPHYHDMGLTGGLLGATYGDIPLVFMSPFAFLSRPARWLRAMTRYRATWSGGPNFAYELCCRQIRPREIAELDLSAWTVAVNGSEPIRRSTIERFCATFEPAGFRASTMRPFYGLAESVVLATGGRPGAHVRMVPGHSFGSEAAPPRSWYAACGPPLAGHRLAIVDPDSRIELEAGEAGEIWLAGPSVAAGYWGRREETEAVFRARLAGGDATEWLRTGDSGFVDEGELVVTGRIKDLIIIAGANHAPQDIEASAEAAHSAIRPGNVVAFALEGATDKLAIAAEIFGDLAGPGLDEVIAAIRETVPERHGISVGAVALLRSRAIPKTSSGKVRRNTVRDAWMTGKLDGLLAEWPPRAAPAAALPAVDAARLTACVARHVRRILDDPQLAVDFTLPVHRLGLGSLDLADLRASVEAELEIELPLARLLQGWSIADIAEELASPPPAEAGGPALHPWEALVNPVIGALLRRFRLDQPFVHGEGAWLTRADGSRVLDAIAGYGALPFGHNPPAIWAALERAFAAREPSLTQPAMNDAAGELARRLLAAAPPGLRHVTFVNSGAEATETALKLVRAATGRRAFLSTANGFHGKTLGALSVTGREALRAPFGAPVFDVDYVPYGELAALERAFAADGARYAGFVVEPIQGEGGIVEPPAGYLAAASSLCRAHGVKLVLDEIQTGLGRTGAMFACEAERVTPDVLLVAKALGGGVLPIGAVLYQPGCYTEVFARNHSSTFAGNALACRVALAALDLLGAEDGALVRDVAQRGARLRDGLGALADLYPGAVRSVRGRGYLLGVQLAGGRADFGRGSLLGVLAEQGALAPLVASYLLNVAHVRVAPTLLGSDVLRIEPPLTLAEAEADRIVAAMGDAARLLAADDTAALVNHLLDRPRSLGPARQRAPAQAPAILSRNGQGPRRWAFLAHPVSPASFAEIDETLAIFSPAELGGLSERIGGALEPFVAGETLVSGADGATAAGQFVIVPWTATALLRDRAGGLEAIRAGAGIARAAGARVLGLGGYVSIAAGGGTDLAEAGVPLTTGNSYTAIAAVDAVEEACERYGLPIGGSVAGIVGALGSVGLGLSYLMAERAGRLVLVGNPAHSEASLRGLRHAVENIVAGLIAERGEGGGEFARRALAYRDRTGGDASAVAAWLIKSGDCAITTDPEAALGECELVLTATSSPDWTIPADLFRRGAILCDVSLPRDLDPAIAETRPDLLVLDGGLVAVPGGPDLGWHFGLPPGVAFACMCEPMILALEERFDAAPQGLGVPLGYLRALRGWGLRHGFRPAELRSFGRPLGDADWRRLRAVRGGEAMREVRAAGAAYGDSGHQHRGKHAERTQS